MATLTKTTMAPQEEETHRRGFMTRAIYAMWGFMTAALGAPAAAYLLTPARTPKNEEWIDIGDITELTPGQPVEMTFRRNRSDAWKVVSEKFTVWVTKDADGSVVAFGPQCTHLGCAYHWEGDKNQFVCPCHNSLFSVDGKVLAGPAPRPLDRYQVKVEGKKVLLGSLRQTPETSA